MTDDPQAPTEIREAAAPIELFFAPDSDYREHYRRAMIWVYGGMPFWIGGRSPDWQ